MDKVSHGLLALDVRGPTAHDGIFEMSKVTEVVGVVAEAVPEGSVVVLLPAAVVEPDADAELDPPQALLAAAKVARKAVNGCLRWKVGRPRYEIERLEGRDGLSYPVDPWPSK